MLDQLVLRDCKGNQGFCDLRLSKPWLDGIDLYYVFCPRSMLGFGLAGGVSFRESSFANEQTCVLQSAPKVEAPLENNVAHDNSTTESSDREEIPKVTPPAVPAEVPANPPSAPAITEDVASVAKVLLHLQS